VKVKLSVGDSPYTDYLNIDPCPKIEQDKLSQFNTIIAAPRDIPVENATCDEILCHSVEYLTGQSVVGFFQLVASKLRHGGKFIVIGTDIEKVCLDYFNGLITTQQFNQIIHGGQTHTWDFKSLQLTQSDVSELMISVGLQIKKKVFDNHTYIITAERV
jgi:hypothetical protein